MAANILCILTILLTWQQVGLDHVECGSGTSVLYQGESLEVSPTFITGKGDLSYLINGLYTFMIYSDCEMIITKDVEVHGLGVESGKPIWVAGIYKLLTCGVLTMEPSGDLVMYGGKDYKAIQWFIRPKGQVRPSDNSFFYLKLLDDGSLHIFQRETNDDSSIRFDISVWSNRDYCCFL